LTRDVQLVAKLGLGQTLGKPKLSNVIDHKCKVRLSLGRVKGACQIVTG
jgi:hypothetical protein